MSVTLADELATVTPLWAQLRVGDRARYLERAAQAVIDEFDEVCMTLAGEARRPSAEIAALELLGAIDALRWLAENARGLLGAHRFALPRALHPLTRASAGHAPVGVVGVRGAFGAPFALPLTVVGAALLAGNGVIVAPAPRDLAGRRAPRARARARRSPRGSRPRGRGLARGLRAARRARRRAGRARRDDRARRCQPAARDRRGAGAACAGAGQLAGSLKRVYVVEEHYAEFLEALAQAATELELGDPLAEHTQLGPLAGEEVAASLEAAIAEAVGFGAVLSCGGRRSLGSAHGVFFAPAVLSGVPPEARLARERVPGPVLAVTRVRDSVEAVSFANRGERCLGASIWSSDRRAAVRIARELEARVVWGNDHAPALPLRQAAADALERCARAQLITWDPPARRPPWHYLYDASTRRAARSVASLHSTREGEREQALRDGAPAIIRLAGRTLRG